MLLLGLNSPYSLSALCDHASTFFLFTLFQVGLCSCIHALVWALRLSSFSNLPICRSPKHSFFPSKSPWLPLGADRALYFTTFIGFCYFDPPFSVWGCAPCDHTLRNLFFLTNFSFWSDLTQLNMKIKQVLYAKTSTIPSHCIKNKIYSLLCSDGSICNSLQVFMVFLSLNLCPSLKKFFSWGVTLF